MSAGSTTRDAFTGLLAEHRVIPVIRELFADGETPVGIYRKLADGAPGSFLLESAEQGGIWSFLVRGSVLLRGAHPDRR